MILKWVGRFLFMMVVLFAALYVVQLGYISRNNEYYTQQVKNNWNDNQVFLEGVSTLQYLDYFQEAPIYTFNANTESTTFDVNIYAIGITYNDAFYNGYMIFVNNVVIYENDEIVQNPILMITVNVTADTIQVDNTYQSQGSVLFDPLSDSFYGNSPVLMLFDVAGNLINDQGTDDTADDVYADLSKITIDYSNRTVEDDNTYLFNSETTDGKSLFVASTNPIEDPALYTDDTLSITASDYQLSDQFIGDTLSDQDVVALGLNTTHGDLTDYNWQIWRTMIIYVFAVLVITYFLFFHKHVRLRFKNKQLDTSSSLGQAKVEPIFKDAPPDDNEDGK